MFILIDVLVIAFIIVISIAFIYWIIDGSLPTVYKYSKRAYKKEQEEGIRLLYPYEYKKIKDFPTITLEQFKDFYAINPDSWELRACRVFKDNNERLSFTFTYEEWKKYIQFRKQAEKEKAQQEKIKEQQKITKEQNETTRKILESVQKDINNIYAEQTKNINDTKRTVEGVKIYYEKY